MIVRTHRQCLKAVPHKQIFVATDDERIHSVCAEHGIQVLMTPASCLTGTDRVYEAAKQLDADVYINVQGDEPLFNPEDLRSLLSFAERFPEHVINGYCAIDDEALFRSETIPKVVMRPDGRLLYMSRAPIPTDKNRAFVKSWRQVCAYAFPYEALRAFASRQEKTVLERIEDIEILRFLEMGYEVWMIEMSGDSIAVDTPEDALKVEKAIRERRL